KAHALLAKEWGVDVSALRFANGVFSLVGSNRTMSIAQITARFPGALDCESLGELGCGTRPSPGRYGSGHRAKAYGMCALAARFREAGRYQLIQLRPAAGHGRSQRRLD